MSEQIRRLSTQHGSHYEIRELESKMERSANEFKTEKDQYDREIRGVEQFMANKKRELGGL